MAITLEVLFIILLTVVNGLLSMSEIAVVSARKVRLQQYAEDGNRGAQLALELAQDPTRFLSTVQIGITLIGILAGALGGATIAEQLGALISRLPWIGPYGEAIGLGIVVLGISYLSLVIGELVPKRLALNNAERIASVVSAPMRRLSALSAPLVYLLSASTDGVVRLLGSRPSSEPAITEEEITLMIDEGTQVGVFEQMERDIVRRVFRLGDRRVSSLMSHRTDIVWLDLDDPLDAIVHQVASSGYSRFPVARGSLDNILGVVQAKDLLAQSLIGQPLDPKAVLYPPLFVPENALVLDVLERLRDSQLPIALIVDEYGGLEGLVTVHDMLGAMVGDLPSGSEVPESEIVQRQDGSWLLDGALAIDKFKEIFDLLELPGEAEGYFETLGGFIMAFLGQIPSATDHFQWGGLCVEVMDMDGRRVDKVLVTPLERGACKGRATEGPKE